MSPRTRRPAARARRAGVDRRLRDGWTFTRGAPRSRPRCSAGSTCGSSAGSCAARSARSWSSARSARTCAARLGVDAGYVPNGWDPDSAEGRRSRGAAARAEGPDARAHGQAVGRLGPAPAATCSRRCAALQRARPAAAARLQLVLAGRLDRDEQELIERARLGGWSVTSGCCRARRRSRCRERGRARADHLADAGVGAAREGLRVLRGRPPDPRAGRATTRPAALVDETGTGWTVPPDDVEAIAELLLRLAREGAELRLRARAPGAATYTRRRRRWSSPRSSARSPRGRRPREACRPRRAAGRARSVTRNRQRAQRQLATRSPSPPGNRQRPAMRYCSEAGQPDGARRAAQLDLLKARPRQRALERARREVDAVAGQVEVKPGPAEPSRLP